MASDITRFLTCPRPKSKSRCNEENLHDFIKNISLILYKFSSDDTATTSFTRTLPMSTYLVAFVISDFEYISDSLNGIRHRVFASPPKINNTQLALNNGMQLLSAIEEYLDINYSFPKMDQIAVPTFRSGGKLP